MQHFIDISNHQSSIRVRDVPTDALIVKATEGRGWRDRSMPNFVAQGRSADKPLGFYHFVSQGNTPLQEVDNFLAYTEGHRRGNDLMVLDWEPLGSNPSNRNVDWARQFLELMTARISNPVWTYMNLSTANGNDWRSVTSRWPKLWLAHYPGNNRATGYNPAGARGRLTGANEWQLAAWQFTDGGRLPGFGGNLDLNQLYMPWWTGSAADPFAPVTKVVVPEIPPLREADPPVHFFHHHGGRVNRSNGAPRLACVCMAMSFPLIEREMIKRGLIKHQIDVFQGGYNRGGVAASAGTHDMGGVIDVAQGQTLEQRRVWADFGVMMFPRTRYWGWMTGDHGHGVWHGCPHQTASADRQVSNGIAGYDGLVSNRRRNFIAPTRTWQDAVREFGRQTITITSPQEDPVPDFRERPYRFTHAGNSGYQTNMDEPLIGADVTGPLHYRVTAVAHGPEGSHLMGRVAFLERSRGEWVGRSPDQPGTGNKIVLSKVGRTAEPEVSLYFDVWSDVEGEIFVEQAIEWWRL